MKSRGPGVEVAVGDGPGVPVFVTVGDGPGSVGEDVCVSVGVGVGAVLFRSYMDEKIRV